MSLLHNPEVDEVLLPVGDYQDWLTAIVCDDAQVVEHALRVADEEQRHLLLNGTFDYQDDDLVSHNPYRCGRPDKPLSLALLSGALKVLSILIGYGVHVTSQNCRGHNVVHQLIFIAFHGESHEARLVGSYVTMMRLVDLHTKRQLLLTESNIGLRPLEAAAQHGTLHFVQAIMETEGVYLRREVVRGLSAYQWYDVTEYESFGADNRRIVSPVRFLMALDEGKLSHSHVNQVLFDKPIGTWISTKASINRPLLAIWALLRCVHLSAYYALDISSTASATTLREKTRNASYIEAKHSPEYMFCEFASPIRLSETPRRAIAVYIIVHSLLILLWDILNFFRLRCLSLYCTTIDGKSKRMVACSLYYARCQRVLATLFIIDAAHKLNDVMSGWSASGVRLMCMVLSTWSLLYFVQLVPCIGYFVVAIQRMVRQMFNFAGVYAIFFFASVSAFFVTINTSERQSCSDDFSSITHALYSTFAIMFSLLNPVQLRLRDPGWMYMQHIVYMFIVAILLINFLIAIMSSALTEVALQRPIIERLQRLSVALAIESRVEFLLPLYYRAMQRRHFVCEEGRIFVMRVTPPCKYADIILAGRKKNMDAKHSNTIYQM